MSTTASGSMVAPTSDTSTGDTSTGDTSTGDTSTHLRRHGRLDHGEWIQHRRVDGEEHTDGIWAHSADHVEAAITIEIAECRAYRKG